MKYTASVCDGETHHFVAKMMGILVEQDEVVLQPEVGGSRSGCLIFLLVAVGVTKRLE